MMREETVKIISREDSYMQFDMGDSYNPLFNTHPFRNNKTML